VQDEVRDADECVAVQVGIVDGSHDQPLEDGGGGLHADELRSVVDDRLDDGVLALEAGIFEHDRRR
jgi:hypothetical protein